MDLRVGPARASQPRTSYPRIGGQVAAGVVVQSKTEIPAAPWSAAARAICWYSAAVMSAPKPPITDTAAHGSPRFARTRAMFSAVYR
jgi:hypothetical protein